MYGYAAYHQTATVSAPGKETEYRLFGQITGELMRAQDVLSDTGNRDRIGAVKTKTTATLRNRELWAALRVDLMSSGNQLDDQLKGNLISLSLWVEKETQTILSGSDDLSGLIDINRLIMEGLAP